MQNHVLRLLMKIAFVGSLALCAPHHHPKHAGDGAQSKDVFDDLLGALKPKKQEIYYDQRQNGTENYRVNVDGVAFVLAYPEKLLHGFAQVLDGFVGAAGGTDDLIFEFEAPLTPPPIPPEHVTYPNFNVSDETSSAPSSSASSSSSSSTTEAPVTVPVSSSAATVSVPVPASSSTESDRIPVHIVYEATTQKRPSRKYKRSRLRFPGARLLLPFIRRRY